MKYLEQAYSYNQRRPAAPGLWRGKWEATASWQFQAFSGSWVAKTSRSPRRGPGSNPRSCALHGAARNKCRRAVSIWMLEKFWKSGNGCITLNVINATEFYISKTVTVAFAILYHNFLKSCIKNLTKQIF